jgi:hypothetical protein
MTTWGHGQRPGGTIDRRTFLKVGRCLARHSVGSARPPEPPRLQSVPSGQPLRRTGLK